MSKYKTPIIISILTFILFFGGLTFAYFFVSSESNTENIISIGDFDINYESGNGINLTNTYPMPDGYGQKTKAHQVTITNNSNTNACYEVNLVDKYTDLSETYLGNSSLTRNQLRYSVNNLTPNTLPTSNDSLYSGILNETEQSTINFRLWIEETETIETAANKEYYGKLIVNTVNCETPPQSTNKNAPTISGEVTYVQEQTIKVINDATFDNGSVAYYEYAITSTDKEPNEETNPIKISGSTLKLTEEQTGYVSFRAISTHDEISPWSNRVVIKIDKTPPTITVDPESSGKEAYKTIILRFSDDKSGIYYYQVTNYNTEPTNWIELTNAQETTATFTATKNGTYYVWSKDKVGNISSQSFIIANIGNLIVDIVDNMITVAWTVQH